MMYVVCNEHTRERESFPLSLEEATERARQLNAEHNRRQAHYGIPLTERYYVAGAREGDQYREWGRA